MDKKLELKVVVAYPDGEMSRGMVHELEGDQLLEVAFGVIHALEGFTEGFNFYYASNEEYDGYTLILSISEDTDKKREDMDEIVHSVLLMATALSLRS